MNFSFLTPTLSWIKSTGPGEENFVKINMIGYNHEKMKTTTNKEKTISNALLKNLQCASSSGSVRAVIMGKLP
ncbi:hypothetical protein ACFLQ4_01635, partial [Bacteroidota bacterium]